MIMADDLTRQLELQTSINKMIEARTVALQTQSTQFTKQTNILNGMIRSLENLRETSSDQSSLCENFRNCADAAEAATRRQNELNESLQRSAVNSRKAGAGFKFLMSPLSAIKKLFTGIVRTAGSVVTAIIDITSSLSKLAITILSFPFKVWRGLIDLAQQGSPNIDLLLAYEEVREAFGDLARGPAKDIISGFKEMRKSSHNLAESGVSLRKIYGWGISGLAGALRDLNEIAKAAGESFSRLGEIFREKAAHVIVYQKGLGIAADNLMLMADVATSRGADVDKYLKDFSETAIETAHSFGLGIKDMAKGMSDLTVDIQNFGHLGPKAFAPITVYARKLGIEIKEMAGIMAKFSGFVDTTEAASKMTQTFGMSVDAMKLMAAQNPAEKIEILRESFFATGQDIKDMNYQQRQYMSQLTGLEGKSLEAAFSLNQQGISYENIAKQSEIANKKQMSQKDVMMELGKQIKRLIQTMDGPHVTGFFDAFLKGFETGVMRSRPFRKMIRSIMVGLRQMRYLGIQVGKAFVHAFPGVKTMLGSISDFLSPKRFKAFRREALPAFKELFNTQNFEVFFDKLSGSFRKNFGDAGGQGGKFLQGFKAFFGAMTNLAGKALGKFTEQFLSTMTLIGKMILDPAGTIAALKSGASSVGKTGSSGLVNLLTPSLEALKGPKGAEFVDVFKKIFSNISDVVWEKMKSIGDKVIAIWKDPEFRTRLFNDVAHMIMDALNFAIEYAKQYPWEAAALIAVFNPFGARSLVIAVGGTILTMLSGALKFALSALPALASGLGGLLKAGFVGVGKGTALIAGSTIGAPIMAAILGLPLGIKVGLDASNLLNNPKYAAMGFETGEAMMGSFVKNLTLGFFDPLGDAEEASAKRLEEWNARMEDTFRKNAKNFSSSFQRDFQDEISSIIKKGGTITKSVNGGISGVDEKTMNYLHRTTAKELMTELIASDNLESVVSKHVADMIKANIKNGSGLDSRVISLFQSNAVSAINEKLTSAALAAQKDILGADEKEKLRQIEDASKKVNMLEMLTKITDQVKTLEEKTKGIDASVLSKSVDAIMTTASAIFDVVGKFSNGIANVINSSKIDNSALTVAHDKTKKFNELFSDFAPMFQEMNESSDSLLKSTSTLGSRFKNPASIAKSLEKNLAGVSATLNVVPAALGKGLASLIEDKSYGYFTYGAITNIISGGLGNKIETIKKLGDLLGEIADSVQELSESAILIKKSTSKFPKMGSSFIEKASLSINDSVFLAESIVSVLSVKTVLNNASTTGDLSLTTKNLDATAIALKALKNVADKASMIKTKDINAVIEIARNINDVSKNLASANKMLEPESIENIRPIIDGLKDFKGGKIQMIHNLPNTTIHLNVHINSKKLGQSIVKTNLAAVGKPPKFASIGDNENKEIPDP